MGSWKENVTLKMCPCRQYQKLKYVRVGSFPVISGVLVKAWEKLQLESRLKNQHLYLYCTRDVYYWPIFFQTFFILFNCLATMVCWTVFIHLCFHSIQCVLTPYSFDPFLEICSTAWFLLFTITCSIFVFFNTSFFSVNAQWHAFKHEYLSCVVVFSDS